MIAAKINANQDVVGVYTVGTIDELLIQALDDGEAFAPMTQSEFDAFMVSKRARYIDGVFTVLESETMPEPDPPTIEGIRASKIKELERYTPRFVAWGSDGSVRYTKEKQSSFHAIYIRCERLSRLPETSPEVKAACEVKIALIESVYSWIELVLARHYVHLNALKTAETLEELDAIIWDYTDLNAADPDVWLEHVI